VREGGNVILDYRNYVVPWLNADFFPKIGITIPTTFFGVFSLSNLAATYLDKYAIVGGDLHYTPKTEI
jgi:hypothetical protein